MLPALLGIKSIMIRPHYFIYMPLFVVILTVLALRHAKMWQIILTCLVFSMHTGHYAYHFARHDSCANQTATYEIMTTLDIKDQHGNEIEGLKIGCWNAGIAGFFCKYPVVNLDGCINNTAYYAIKLHRLSDYFIQDGIMLYFDHKSTFDAYAPYYGRPTRFTELRRWGDYVLCQCEVADIPQRELTHPDDIYEKGEVIE